MKNSTLIINLYNTIGRETSRECDNSQRTADDVD